jgi:hypothetical protein
MSAAKVRQSLVFASTYIQFLAARDAMAKLPRGDQWELADAFRVAYLRTRGVK